MDTRKTHEYYNRNAKEYFSKTKDMPIDLRFFTRFLCRGDWVLDAGCGSGRDALSLRKQGFSVEAFDASEELAELAAELLMNTGVSVEVCRFQDYAGPVETFNGILASASLLHVPPDELPGSLGRLFRTLVDGGVLCATFKLGTGTAEDSAGRFFHYVTREVLEKAFLEVPSVGSLEFENVSGSSSGGEKTEWLYVYAMKKNLFV